MECQPSTSKSNEPNDDSGDDEASNIEVSWEVLCLAKNVFSRHLDRNDNKFKLAETLQKLGEISIEWENNANAIDLLTECLNLRKQILPEDDRLIAETWDHLIIRSEVEPTNGLIAGITTWVSHTPSTTTATAPTIASKALSKWSKPEYRIRNKNFWQLTPKTSKRHKQSQER